MRKGCIIIALCALFVFASATQSAAELEALLQMKAQASGAIDTVLNLLEDLRKASLNERADVEKRNTTQQKDGERLIAELEGLLAIAQKNLDGATEHKEFIEKEINDTEAHLIWIENRVAEIARKLKELKKQRCKANMILIDNLREHIDALKSVAVLEQEITRLHAAGELTEISSLTEKLQAYQHLFEKDTIDKFLQLSDERKVDEITGHQDNKRGELKLEGMKTNPGQRNLKGNLAEKVLQMLKDLTAHLKASIKDLQSHEIQAAYDYADFKSNSYIENATLHDDHTRKEKYLAKLQVELEVAEQNEDTVLALRDESQLNVDSARADLTAKQEYYSKEVARIIEDLSTIEQVIAVFKDKIASIEGGLKDRIDEHDAGDKMTQFKRVSRENADATKGKIGNVHDAVEGTKKQNEATKRI